MSANIAEQAEVNSHRLPRAYSVEDAARELGIGRSLMYDLVKRGEVRTVKLGRRRVVPAVELDRLLGEV